MVNFTVAEHTTTEVQKEEITIETDENDKTIKDNSYEDKDYNYDDNYYNDDDRLLVICPSIKTCVLYY